MTMISENIEADTQERILVVAEQFFHPQMIAEAVAKPFGPKLDQMIDFILASLAPRGRGHKQ